MDVSSEPQILTIWPPALEREACGWNDVARRRQESCLQALTWYRRADACLSAPAAVLTALAATAAAVIQQLQHIEWSPARRDAALLAFAGLGFALTLLQWMQASLHLRERALATEALLKRWESFGVRVSHELFQAREMRMDSSLFQRKYFAEYQQLQLEMPPDLTTAPRKEEDGSSTTYDALRAWSAALAAEQC